MPTYGVGMGMPTYGVGVRMPAGTEVGMGMPAGTEVDMGMPIFRCMMRDDMGMMPRLHRHLLAPSGFGRLLAYVTPHRRVLLLAVVLMVGESAIALANPWIAGRFAELVLHSPASASPEFGVPGLMVVWALLLAAQSGLSFGNRYLLGGTGETMLAGLRSRLYDHLQSLPLSYFHERRRGEVLALLGNDAAHISNFVTGTLVSLLPLLITFAGAFYFLYLISPTIALLAGGLVPLFFLVMKLIGRRLRPLSSEWVRTHAEMFATLEENIGMLPAIKSFTREGAPPPFGRAAPAPPPWMGWRGPTTRGAGRATPPMPVARCGSWGRPAAAARALPPGAFRSGAPGIRQHGAAVALEGVRGPGGPAVGRGQGIGRVAFRPLPRGNGAAEEKQCENQHDGCGFDHGASH